MKDSKPNQQLDEYTNFTEGLKRILAVPKSEIDKREKEWQETEHKRGRPKKPVIAK